MQHSNQIYIPPAPEATPGSHSEQKPYHCDDCDKTFRTSGHLARHRRVHVGDRQYACSFPGCSTRCSRKDNLAQHYRIHFDLRTPEDLAREAPGKRRRKMRVARVTRDTRLVPSGVGGLSPPFLASSRPAALTGRRSKTRGPPPMASPRSLSPASSSCSSSFSDSSSSSASGADTWSPSWIELGYAPSLPVSIEYSGDPGSAIISSLPSPYASSQGDNLAPTSSPRRSSPASTGGSSSFSSPSPSACDMPWLPSCVEMGYAPSPCTSANYSTAPASMTTVCSLPSAYVNLQYGFSPSTYGPQPSAGYHMPQYSHIPDTHYTLPSDVDVLADAPPLTRL
ncbi:hypothetical protein C8R47DRAFT_727332 [Mycena vitilis]|nr:hypothetical protein C8R47DRAFT_727332 [Mycena vitilis]